MPFNGSLFPRPLSSELSRSASRPREQYEGVADVDNSLSFAKIAFMTKVQWRGM